jgi:hypothetical protein
VHTDRIHKDVVEVDVGVDCAGQYQQALGINLDVGFAARQIT